MNPAAPTTPHPLSKSELPALTNQALEANLIQISTTLLASGRMLATAESCTGGMIAAACTDLAGSSQWFERGFVTYSNEAKTELLGVRAVERPIANTPACTPLIQRKVIQTNSGNVAQAALQPARCK